MKTKFTLRFIVLFTILLNSSTLIHSQLVFEVLTPAAIAGTYDFIPTTDWGGAFPSESNNFVISGELAIIDDGDDEGGNGSINDACQVVNNNLTGKIAFIEPGNCEYGTQALNAQNAGCIAVIICSDIFGSPVDMGGGMDGGSVTVPVWSISQSNCQNIRLEIPDVQVQVSFQENPDAVKELNTENIVQLSPNPADEFVFLDVDLVNIQSEVQVNIVNINGEVVFSTIYENVSKELFEIDINTLNSGMYFLNFVTEEGVRTEPLIVMR